MSFFQNFLIGQITKTLSKKLQTTVSIKHVDFELFDRIRLDNTLVLDHQSDTLLYAGAVRLSITDWFFLKDKIELKFIGLDDAVIKMNRKTPDWNYQFLADFFGSGSGSDKESKPIDLNLKIISLKNVSIYQQDQWLGRDMFVSVKTMRLDADLLDIQKRNLNINQINLEQPVFAQYDYTGLRPPKEKKPQEEPDSVAPDEPFNPDGWKILAKRINITEGKVAIERETNRPSVMGQFDEKHIILSKLNATLRNTQLEADTLTSEIDFSVKDRGGFTIKKFNSRFKMTPKSMEFFSLNLETEKSRLRDYFSMYYNDFNKDMNDFINKVQMKGNFNKAIISSDDLAYFAPAAKDWGVVFDVDGNVTGKVNNLTVQNANIRAGNETLLTGDASLRDMQNLDEGFMDLRVKELKTNMRQLARFIPAVKKVTQPDLLAFGNISFTGSFTGYLNDFVAYGKMATQIGNLSTDLHLKIPDNSISVYNGSVSTTNFNLGKFLSNNQLGIISFGGNLNGKGFTGKTMDININGNIDRLQFNGYDYTNIAARGKLKKDIFAGSASVRDPNLWVDTLTGTLNFSRDNPSFDLQAEVLALNFKNLGLMPEAISFGGILDFNFTGNNIDNFLGTARITDAVLLNDGKRLSFDSLTVTSSEFDSHKVLSLQTNELEASINGNFKIIELPKAFQLFLSRYYPAYIKEIEGKTNNQNFSFMVHTRAISNYMDLFAKDISGLDNSVVEGQLNIADNLLELDANIPQFAYKNFAFKDIHLSGQGTKDTLGFYLDIDDVIVDDSLHSPRTRIEATSSNDISEVHITTSPNNEYYSADLSARIKTMNDGVTVSFNPSVFVLNQKKWAIEKGGEIALIGKIIMANHLRFYQNGQELLFTTQFSDVNNSNDLNISMKNFVVEDVLPFFLKTPEMKGLLSGNVRIQDPLNHLKMDFDASISEFHFEEDSIGIIQAKGNYDNRTQSFFASVNSENHPYRFNANLLYQVADSLNPLSGTANFDYTEVHLLEPYLSGIVSDIHGKAKGILNISGKPEAPKITGSIKLDSTSLKVDYTQCKYNLAPGSVITFNEDEIDFGTLAINDFKNRKATLTGKIYHNFFDNFFFNELHINTQNNFQLLNTTAKDNDQFYGQVTGQASLSLNGFTTDMRMIIKGEPTDSSHIFLPISETVESGSLDYIEFLQFGREMTLDKKTRENTNIRVDMELTANPLATIDVILDETTGDVIKGQGSGKLFISAGTKDPLTIRGRYTIEQGQYTFNFQTFLKTPFVLEQGFIEWQGDPYEAMLDIDAVYKAQNVNLSNIPTSTGATNIQGDIDIIFKLRGTLKNPTPQFEFQFPFDNPLKSDPIASEFLKTRFQTDNNEMLNQVASLLLFNTFLTTDQRSLTGNATGNFVSKTVGQLLSATLTSSLNNWLQKLLNTKTINLYTNINTLDFNFQRSMSDLPVQNIGTVGLRYAFPNRKFIINVGSNLNYKTNPGLANTNSDLLITPDISFEMLLSPSGNLRVIGFNRSDFDPVSTIGLSSLNRTGVQLSYRKDFETFEDFFTGKKRK